MWPTIYATLITLGLIAVYYAITLAFLLFIELKLTNEDFSHYWSKKWPFTKIENEWIEILLGLSFFPIWAGIYGIHLFWLKIKVKWFNRIIRNEDTILRNAVSSPGAMPSPHLDMLAQEFRRPYPTRSLIDAQVQRTQQELAQRQAERQRELAARISAPVMPLPTFNSIPVDASSPNPIVNVWWDDPPSLTRANEVPLEPLTNSDKAKNYSGFAAWSKSVGKKDA